MFEIIDKRASGKTSRLMLIAKETNSVLVCANPRCIEQKAIDYGLTGLCFMSYQEYINYHPTGRDSINVVIDEPINLLKHINNATIVGYSLSIGDN